MTIVKGISKTSEKKIVRKFESLVTVMSYELMTILNAQDSEKKWKEKLARRKKK